MSKIITYPKYIIRRSGFHIDLLILNRFLPDRDIAEYGRINDRGTICWRSLIGLVNKEYKQDLLYFGKVKHDE